MLFTKIYPLLNSLGIKLEIKSVDEGQIRLIVSFKMKDEKDNNIPLAPLVLVATPQDFDEELIDSLVEHLQAEVPSISNQINILTSNLKKVLDDKTKAAKPKEVSGNEMNFEEGNKETETKKEETVTPPVKRRKRRSKEQIAADKAAKEAADKEAKEVKEEPIKAKMEVVKEVEPEVKEEIIDRIELDAEDDDNPFGSDDDSLDLDFGSDDEDDEDPFA